MKIRAGQSTSTGHGTGAAVGEETADFLNAERPVAVGIGGTVGEGAVAGPGTELLTDTIVIAGAAVRPQTAARPSAGRAFWAVVVCLTAIRTG